MKKILFIAGTRPEIIKLAPLLVEMRNRQDYTPVLCMTGQHSDLADDALAVFNIKPDVRLHTMKPGQQLAELLAALFQNLAPVLAEQAPHLVIVQGDTASAYAGAWTAFLQRVPVLHVEAGLRTGDLHNPFPEEAHRRAISLVSTFHAAPTMTAKANLTAEGVSPEKIAVTGNTVIDALYSVRDRLQLDQQRFPSPAEVRQILVTCHRRENFGAGINNICSAVARIATQQPDVQIVWVRHPNPAANTAAQEKLSELKNVRLVPPLGFTDFLQQMLRSYFIISDSGGIQEEAPALGRPVLVTRTTTERPEAVEIGANRLTGTDTDAIYNAAAELLASQDAYNKMATTGSPYGDGTASKSICDFLDRVAF